MIKKALVISFSIVISVVVTIGFFFIDENLGLLVFKMIFFIYMILFWAYYIPISNRKDIERNLQFVKSNRDRLNSLFSWLGEEKNSDRIIYELVGNIIDLPNEIATMKYLKTILEIEIGNNLSDYYLIRDLLQDSSKISLIGYLKKSILLIVPVAVTATINSLIKNFKLPKVPRDELFLLIFDIMIYFFIILGFVILIYQSVSKSKRRAAIVITILNEIIRQKEKEIEKVTVKLN